MRCSPPASLPDDGISANKLTTPLHGLGWGEASAPLEEPEAEAADDSTADDDVPDDDDKSDELQPAACTAGGRST